MKNTQKKPFQIKTPSFKFDLTATEDLPGLIDACRRNDEDIHYQHIKNVTLDNKTFSNLEFGGVIFENCTIKNTDFAKSSFDNVLFESCDFSGSNFSDSWFSTCAFRLAKNIGTDFSSGKFFNVEINDSSFKYSKFSSSKFDTCAVIKSDMSETFFAQCSFKSMELADSKFIRTDFFKTPLAKLDFSTCDLQAIAISEDNKELRGVIVNTYQAVELSKFLGLVIKDE